MFHSLRPVRSDSNLKCAIFKHILVTAIESIPWDFLLMWIPDFINDKSTLVQVMTWCHQAPSHYLNQCWVRSVTPYSITRPQWVNTLRPRQNGRHFADAIFKCIFVNEYVWIPIKNSLKFVPKGPINNMAALVQIMAWRRAGDKPLSEPMMVSLRTHICVTRPQWVKLILVVQRAFSN